MTEKSLMHEIMYAVSNIPGVRIFRNNIGLAKFPGGARVKYGLIPGASDLIGWRTVNNRAIFIALEVKTDGGKVTPGQENFIARVKEAGGIAGVVRSVEEAVALVSTVGKP